MVFRTDSDQTKSEVVDIGFVTEQDPRGHMPVPGNEEIGR
jgi:hypothetical protein